MFFVTVWFRLKPDTIDEFMAFMTPLVPWVRTLDGVDYFELARRTGEDDVVVVTERFRDKAAHGAMWATPQFAQVGQLLDRTVIGRRVDTHSADDITTDTAGDHPPTF
jgi:quinol monooxygenase YgiN